LRERLALIGAQPNGGWQPTPLALKRRVGSGFESQGADHRAAPAQPASGEANRLVTASRT